MQTRRLRFEGLEDRRVLAVFYLAAGIEDGVAASLREAIAIANQNQEDDEIHLVEGVYDLTLAGQPAEDANVNGDLDFTEGGKSVTIIGAGRDRSIIDAAQLSDRVLEVLAGVRLTLQGVTIRNGNSVVQGGGIRNAGTLEIHDTVVSQNSSDLGGGIYNAGGELVIANSVLQENAASDGGGLLSFEGQATISDSEIQTNAATGSRGEVSAKPLIFAGNGGGILNVSGSLTMYRSVVEGNTAQRYGGGVGTAGGTMKAHQSAFSRNSAVAGGGVVTLFAMLGEAAMVSHFRWPAEAATLEIRQSTFSENFATRDGGGLHTNGGAQVDIQGSTFSRNRAGNSPTDASKGGGMYLNGSNSEIRILDSTITENSAQWSGGIFHGYYPQVHVGNSIIAGNQVFDTEAFVDVDGGSNLGGNFISEGNNLIGNAGLYATGFVDGVHDDRVGGNGRVPMNAMLVPVQENGEPTGTYAPTSCSEAIEIGAGASKVVDEGSSQSLRCHGSAVADWFTFPAGNYVLPVTANDLIAEDGAAEIAWVGEPTHGGTLSISADRTSVHYSPADGFRGLESFAYAIEGPNGEFEHAIVSISVIYLPFGGSDGFGREKIVIQRDSNENVIDVLANDPAIDVVFGVLPIIGVTNGEAGGSVELAADGRSVLYTPPGGFVGEDTFEYTLVGGHTNRVRVRVYEPESAVQASDHHYTVIATAEDAGSVCNPEDQACPLMSIDDGWHLPVLDNRSDGSIETDLLTIDSVSETDQEGYAEIYGIARQWIQYRPRPGFTGLETFTYVTRDREGRTSTGTVTVDVIRLEELARIRLEATDEAGNAIDSIRAGQSFQLRVMAQDLRPDTLIVNDLAVLRRAAWYADGKMRAVRGVGARVGFDSTLVSVDGDVQFRAPYGDSLLNIRDPVVKLSTDHVELNAHADWIREIGAQDVVFATIPLVAKASGPIAFTLEPTSGVDLFMLQSVPNYAVDYQGVTLNMVSDFRNSNGPEDVNSDGITSPVDALMLINDLNENGSRPLRNAEGEQTATEPARPKYYPDVNDDGWLTPNDVLVVFNRLNVNTQLAAEGEFSGEELLAATDSETAANEPLDLRHHQPMVPIFSSLDRQHETEKSNQRVDQDRIDSRPLETSSSAPQTDPRNDADSIRDFDNVNHEMESELFTALAIDALTANFESVHA